MPELVSPAALLLYIFASCTHVAAVNVSQTGNIYREVVPAPCSSDLTSLDITSAELSHSKPPHLHSVHQK